MAATRKLRRSPSAAASGDHLRFLRPGALARLRDDRLRRATRLPPPSSPAHAPAPASFSSPLPASGDGEGVAAVPCFAPASRLLAPRCPQRKKVAAAKSVVLFALSPPSTDLPIEFLNAPDMVVAAH